MTRIKGAAAAVGFAVCAAGGLGAQGVALSAGAYGEIFAAGTIKQYDGGAKDNSLLAGAGFGVFFDAAYAEIGLGFGFGSLSYDGADFDMMFWTLSALAKYPIVWNARVTLFPLAGVGWKVFLAGKPGAGGGAGEVKRADLPDAGVYDVFSIEAGAGADFMLTEKLYLRISALLGFRLPNKAERREIADEGAQFFACGPAIKAGLGLRF